MSKSKKSKRSNRAPKSHLKAVPSSGVPLDLFRASREVDSYTPAFVRWFGGGTGPDEDAVGLLHLMETVFTAVHEVSGACSATAFSPGTVAVILDELPDHVAEAMADAWHTYVDFLMETGRWTGTQEEYDGVHQLLTGGVPAAPDFTVTPPGFSAAGELEAFDRISLVQRVDKLLEWVGESRKVTGTGALRLKDIEQAAACVGVKARGVQGRTQAAALPGFELENVPDGHVVNSMHQVPILNVMWETLVSAGYLELGSTVVWLDDKGEQFLRGSPEEQAEARRDFVAAYLRTSVVAESAIWEPEQPVIAAMQMGVLLKGASSSPVPRGRFDKDPGDDPADIMAGFTSLMVRNRLDTLTDLGVLAPGTHYTVVPVAAQCVKAAFESAFALAMGAEDESAYDDGRTPAREYAGLSNGTAKVFQLKVMLQGSKPSIWRRVLIPETTELSALHEVIQSLFEWMGYHLHLFRAGIDFRAVQYGPVSQNEYGDDDYIDESKTTVGQLLQREGDRMTYVYDFGDDWEHRITLEKIVYPEPGQKLPKCISGRGAAPAEDSGGVWGWADAVQAANTPSHPEHREMRDWLGLGKGETLDPLEFDLEVINEELELQRV